jgi:hypothetical protein
MEATNGFHLSRPFGAVRRPRRRPRQGLRPPGRTLMSWLVILAGIAAGALLLYLIAALLFPEK